MENTGILSMKQIQKFFKKKSTQFSLLLVFILFYTYFVQQDRLDRFDMPAISLILGVLTTIIISRNNFKGNILTPLKTILFEFDLQSSLGTELFSWAYFAGNVVFWTSNIDNFIFTALSEYFIYQLFISTGVLLLFRIILQTASVIISSSKK